MRLRVRRAAGGRDALLASFACGPTTTCTSASGCRYFAATFFTSSSVTRARARVTLDVVVAEAEVLDLSEEARELAAR